MKRKNGNKRAAPSRCIRIDPGAKLPDPRRLCEIVVAIWTRRRATGEKPVATLHDDSTWSLAIEHRTGLVCHVLSHVGIDAVIRRLAMDYKSSRSCVLRDGPPPEDELLDNLKPHK